MIVSFCKRSCFLLFFLAFLFGGTLKTVAQESEDEMRLLAYPMPDSILIRWAPTSYSLWLNGNLNGYMLSRTTILRDGEFLENPEPELLTPLPLKPAPLADWEQPAEANDYAAIAAQAIYGEGFEVEAGGQTSGVVDIINRATEQQSKLGFALLAADISPQVAKLSALWYTDKEVTPGEKYLYKVWPVVNGELAPDTAFFYTGVDEYRPVPAPANLMASPKDKSVSLTWEKRLQGGIFSGYWIERSVDGENFTRLNTSLLINTTPEGRDEPNFHYYLDSLPNNQDHYYYRVIGVSPFGIEGSPSKIVSVKGKKEIMKAPVIIKSESTIQGVEIRWTMSSSAQVEGFRIYRSPKFKDGYTILADSLSIMQESFLDTDPLLKGYYRVQAYNNDGDGPLGTPNMVQVIDSVPPAIPSGLRAQVDSLGKVILEWDKNTDPDIFGYRVFRANSRHEEFSQLTDSSVLTNVFLDSINIKTLTKKIFYKVIAVDRRQNWSDFSQILEIERPDIVPPASPLITSINYRKGGIELNWNLSPSKDVQSQVIYRNKQGSHKWTVIKKLNSHTSFFKDSLLIPDILYRYLILAVDSAGNESSPGKAVGGKMPFAELQKVKELKVSYDKELNASVLSWKYNRTGFTFLIYKKTEEGTRLILSTKEHEFKDYFSTEMKSVSYSVVVKSIQGKRSGFSEFVKIEKR